MTKKRSCFMLLLTALAYAESNTIFTDVANFCKNNGLVYLTATSIDGSLMKNELSQAFEAFQDTRIRFRALPQEEIESSMEFHFDDFLVISQGLENSQLFQSELDAIKLRKIRKSVLLIPKQINEIQLMEELQAMQGNAFFYLAYPDSSSEQTHFKQVISLSNNSQTLVTEIEFNQFGHIIENYNLGGNTIFSNTLPWAPYFLMEGCDENGRNCINSGFLADFMDALGRVLNFTWISHQPPDGSWGVTPLDGIFNRSGTWGGAMGSVVNGEYHISLSQWVWLIGRYELLDFVSTTTSFEALALTPAPPEIDFGLFIRPFKNEAWYGIGIIMLIGIVVVMVPYAFLSYYEHTDGYNMASTSIWMFFLLVNAFYGGALTMFFTSELGIPFNTIQDVMKAYPDYKLMMMTGNEVNFVYKALSGDPLYAAFWDRIQNKPEETVFNGIKQGLDRLVEGPNVIHFNYGALLGYFQANPFHQQNVKVFAKGRAEYFSLVLPFNSPLKPILQKGVNSMIEGGTAGYLLKQWEGKGIPVNAASELMVLSAGQVLLVFVVVFFTFGFAGAIFCCEVCHKKLKTIKAKRFQDVKKGKMKKKADMLPKEFLKYPDSANSKWGDYYGTKDLKPQILWY